MNSGPPSSTTQRLAIDPLTNLPSINTFGELSNFLRSAIADEDSRMFSESMAALALQAEAVVQGLRESRKRDAAGPLLMDLLTVLRDHRTLVVNLGLAWRGLYEYAAYLQTLNNFRVLIGQWLQAPSWQDELEVTASDVELIAWRTMGEGMLLVDMYEQWLERENEATEPRSNLASLEESQVERVLQWWHKLRR